MPGSSSPPLFLPSAPPFRSFVILGLDPRIHAGTSGTTRSL